MATTPKDLKTSKTRGSIGRALAKTTYSSRPSTLKLSKRHAHNGHHCKPTVGQLRRELAVAGLSTQLARTHNKLSTFDAHTRTKQARHMFNSPTGATSLYNEDFRPKERSKCQIKKSPTIPEPGSRRGGTHMDTSSHVKQSNQEDMHSHQSCHGNLVNSRGTLMQAIRASSPERRNIADQQKS